jgi:activator of HSP90 ATPase
VRDIIRSKLIPQLRQHLAKLAPALITEHGKDIQHTPDSNPASGVSTPKPHSVKPNSQLSNDSSKVDQPTTSSSNVNVTTLTSDTEFRTTAEELFITFTDPQRIAAFTRGAPKKFEGAKPAGKFEIFDGNVSGEFTELQRPTKIVQKWRLRQWPAGHFSSLKIEFDQNDVDAVTIMRVQWTGVPVGQEEVTRRNWDEYYIRSIKTTFGFGTLL